MAKRRKRNAPGDVRKSSRQPAAEPAVPLWMVVGGLAGAAFVVGNVLAKKNLINITGGHCDESTPAPLLGDDSKVVIR